MNREFGFSLIELMITLAIVGAMVTGAAALSVPWIARENANGATHEIASALQLTRMEAVKRNVDCRLTIETDVRRLQIWDSGGTSSTADDDLIHTVNLSAGIAFARPDPGDAVTLDEIDGTTYSLTFSSDGSVRSGQGELVLYGGGSYRRLSIYAAGGMQVRKWNGAAWVG